MGELINLNDKRKKVGCYGTELEVHYKKCCKMFDDIKNENILYISIERIVSEDELENEYINEKALDGKQYVRVSLLTDEIIEYDLEMFRVENGSELLKKYRPYFANFIVPLEENINGIRSIADGWHIGRFIRSRKFSNDGIILSGTLEASASPVNYLDGNLLIFTNKAIKKSILDKINSTYDPKRFILSKNSDVEAILNKAWAEDLPDKIDIYNVGHGNADYIKGTSHRILYDIGYNYRCFPTYQCSRYLRATRAIRHLKPSCVILSHWDMDHIIGCAYAEQDIFSKKWVAPSLISNADKSATPNSIRLAHYLKVLGNLYLVDRDQKPGLIATISCARTVKMKLWLGGGKSILTPKNREGLMLEIIDSSKNYPHILLAGDVPYQCMPNILGIPIDFMHVPHHCSNMELGRLKGIPGKGRCAVISTNRKKCGKLNYNKDHHDELENKFADVINTIDNALGDEANLSIQIDCMNKVFCFR